MSSLIFFWQHFGQTYKVTYTSPLSRLKTILKLFTCSQLLPSATPPRPHPFWFVFYIYIFPFFLTYRVTYTSRLVMAQNIFWKINRYLKYIFFIFLTTFLTYNVTPPLHPPHQKKTFFSQFVFLVCCDLKKIYFEFFVPDPPPLGAPMFQLQCELCSSGRW